MSGSHRSQHYVPKSYLAAWCDPQTPAGMEPYVWTFDPSGGEGKKRAPSNLFTETNIYTILKPDGTRDLRVEHELSKLEKGLQTLVQKVVGRRLQLTVTQQLSLTTFIAAMHGRTPQAREIQRTLWQDMLDVAERKESNLGPGPSEEGTFTVGPSVNRDKLRKAVDSPMQFLLPGAMADGLPLLRQMTMSILCADEPSFITSDSPVTWFDPTVPREQFLAHKSSLSDAGIEVAMPFSPWHTIILHHPMTPFMKQVKYVTVNASTVAAINRRTAHYADKAIVYCKDGFDPAWRILPPDTGMPPNQSDP